MMNATYSPDDNKLRLYASTRLDAETYARVKAAGFKWAPKQELFVAPMWTPDREDLLTELCEEIGDEDTSLIDRAEERAERFEDYSDKRMADANRAKATVDAIADNIPLGQPILVGHHSEKHARRDAERIENGMRKAVKMWRTSQYWTARAAGAVRHAKYKELPEVRARRIKTIEADKRKSERSKAESEMWLKLWTACGGEADADKQMKIAIAIADRCWLHLPRKEGDKPDFDQRPTASDGLTNRYPNLYAPRTVAEVVEHAKRVYPRSIEQCDRWIEHYDNRLAYERAMLEEQGATQLLAPKPRRELMPLLNYRATGGAITTENQYDRGRTITYPQVEMTKAEYAKINNDYRGVRLGSDKLHRFRTAMIKHSLVSVFLTDSKAHQEPKKTEPAEFVREFVARPPRTEQTEKPEASSFEAMADTLRNGGVQVVTAPQLFPTPASLAEEVAELADLQDGHRLLEPSAGTGMLLDVARRSVDGCLSAVAVEINPQLAQGLAQRFPGVTVVNADFLDMAGCTQDAKFDRIVMNPPFENGADIRHIEHARTLLRPGGRIVAICANGPRQRAKLQPIAVEWRDLPAGTFKESGTMVNTALVVIDAAL
ncbi:DUF3560 domain-containing protein [Bradyrhizobium sp. Tv2a-2]|uniref:DUF3560 domain-containing protein n=1 Tax=Bradyrhizobium sp. Tv2a-2 TaxID=113395 RepID=UPI00041A76B3|nr:DUF3560 domain-containing protein [Bradyrhizobium sp. Tv2a-2]